MTSILWWLAQGAVSVAALVVIVLVACRFLRHRPAVRHALWLVVLVKFVTPSLLTWPWPAPSLVARSTPRVEAVSDEIAIEPAIAVDPAPVPFREDLASAEVVALAPAPVDLDPVASTGGAHESGAAPERQSPTPLETMPLTSSADSLTDYSSDSPADGRSLVAPLEPPMVANPRFDGGLDVLEGALRWIFCAWVTGCVIALMLRARQIVRHWSMLRTARPAPAKLADEVAHVARGLGLRPVPALVLDGIGSPFVWCFGRLRLVWPERLTGDAELGRCRGVVAHELAHVLRRDHWVAWLELAAGVLWWWCPLYWFVRRQVRETAEMACDAVALDALPDGRRAYAELFLELSSSIETRAPATFLGVRADARNSFERRFSMILSDRVSSKTSLCGLLLAGLLACVAVPGWSLGQADSPSEAELSDSSGVAGDPDPPTASNARRGDEAKTVDSGSVSSQAPTLESDAATAQDADAPAIATHPAGTSSKGIDARLRRLEEVTEMILGKLDRHEAIGRSSARAQRIPEPVKKPKTLEFGGRRFELGVGDQIIFLRANDADNRVRTSYMADTSWPDDMEWYLARHPDGEKLIARGSTPTEVISFTLSAETFEILLKEVHHLASATPPGDATHAQPPVLPSTAPDVSDPGSPPSKNPASATQPRSALSLQSRSGSQASTLTDAARLAQAYSDAIGDVKLAEAKLDKVTHSNSGTRYDTLEAEVVVQNARRNRDLQQSIMEAAVAETQAELEYAESLLRKGFRGPSHVEGVRSRLKILESVWPKRKTSADGDATKTSTKPTP